MPYEQHRTKVQIRKFSEHQFQGYSQHLVLFGADCACAPTNRLVDFLLVLVSLLFLLDFVLRFLVARFYLQLLPSKRQLLLFMLLLDLPSLAGFYCNYNCGTADGHPSFAL